MISLLKDFYLKSLEITLYPYNDIVMNTILTNMFPLLLIILLGKVAKSVNLIKPETIDDIKKIIINIALPGVLFMAFSQSEFSLPNLVLIVFVYIFCLLLFVIGGLLHKAVPKIFPNKFTDAYFTGFEFGMVGVGLFTAFWGVEKLPIVAMIALGHEIFIWFTYVPVLEARNRGTVNFKRLFKDFFTTPIIIGILLGILINILGLYPVITGSVLGTAILKGLTILGGLITPMILIVIGYSLTFKKVDLVQTGLLIFVRFGVIILGGIILMCIFIKLFPNTDPFIVTAFYGFILLPPPFILPLFIQTEDSDERSYFSGVLVYYTVVSIFAYVIMFIKSGAV